MTYFETLLIAEIDTAVSVEAGGVRNIYFVEGQSPVATDSTDITADETWRKAYNVYRSRNGLTTFDSVQENIPADFPTQRVIDVTGDYTITREDVLKGVVFIVGDAAEIAIDNIYVGEDLVLINATGNEYTFTYSGDIKSESSKVKSSTADTGVAIIVKQSGEIYLVGKLTA
jgi:hypothetical protein